MEANTRLHKKYKEEIIHSLQDKFGYKSHMEVPKITKICLNQGIGEATQDKKIIEDSLSEVSTIAGQKAVSTKAKKSVSNFKLREGQVIGTRVTLRRDRMYEFLDRLINVALPRVRDFRGINERSFDGNGNYSFGVTEQIIFPEIDIEKVSDTRGMDITIVTSADTDAEAYELLKGFGMPFKNKNN